MLPSRFTFTGGQSNAMRKSRLEGKQSFLPKPRNAGSIDRLSSEIRRPSTTRSSSAEPQRGTVGGGRLSREASASKIPLNRRSRSQQNEGARYGQAPITPKRSNQFSRPTTTPQRTPSEDRSSCNWQTSLDRALAFVTTKDQRPIGNAIWQRGECRRVQDALAERGGGGGGAPALMRPLTITIFVEITASLLRVIIRESRLSNDNYVTKIPHIAKLLLYPGTVSKSWLKTVNTLHAFPHALALIAYLLDLVNRLEQEVLDEWLYVSKDELAVLRRDFLYKSWLRFQDPDSQFDDLVEDYLHSLQLLLGNDEEKIAELMDVIKKYELCLEDAAEVAARQDEARRNDRRAALLAALREARGARVSLRAELDGARVARGNKIEELKATELEIEKVQAECQQLRKEVEEQPMSTQERTRLLDEMEYALRMQDSKCAAAEQITKMLYSKEAELALWQKKTLDSCVEYNQGLIHLSVLYPTFGVMAINEKELMGPACAGVVEGAVTSLRQHTAELAERLASAERVKNTRRRHRANRVDEGRATYTELQTAVKRETESYAEAQALEQGAAARWGAEEAALCRALDELRARCPAYADVARELLFWEQQEQSWCSKLSELREYVKRTRESCKHSLQVARQRRATLVCEAIKSCHDALDRLTEPKA